MLGILVLRWSRGYTEVSFLSRAHFVISCVFFVFPQSLFCSLMCILCFPSSPHFALSGVSSLIRICWLSMIMCFVLSNISSSFCPLMKTGWNTCLYWLLSLLLSSLVIFCVHELLDVNEAWTTACNSDIDSRGNLTNNSAGQPAACGPELGCQPVLIGPWDWLKITIYADCWS